MINFLAGMPILKLRKMPNYKLLHRPGYFGRRRDAIVASYNKLYGENKWTLVWVIDGQRPLEFLDACIMFYETSYLNWFEYRVDDLKFITSFGECIDNAPTNIESGTIYAHQESFSTHIQDIAIRNVLFQMGLEFKGPADKILVIRSSDSNGHKYGPGNIPFYNTDLISQPSLCPKWANKGSVEDFWQSNKWVALRD